MNTEIMEDKSQATDLIALPPAERALLVLDSKKTEIDLRAKVAEYATIVEIKNDAGRQQCHSGLMVFVAVRNFITKAGKTAREDATAFSKAVLAEVARLIEIIDETETRLRTLRDNYDEAAKAAKEAHATLERARIAAIHEHIAEFDAVLVLSGQCRTAARMTELLNAMKNKWAARSADQFFSDFAEFGDAATAVYEATVIRIAHRIAEKQAAEEERAELLAQQDAVRLAQEAAAAKLAEAEAKLAADRKVLEDERAADKLAAEQREAKQKAEIEAEREVLRLGALSLAADLKALKDAQDTQLRADEKAQDALVFDSVIADIDASISSIDNEQHATELQEINDEFLALSGHDVVIECAGVSSGDCEAIAPMVVQPITNDANNPDIPSAEDLIAAVSVHFFVSMELAGDWLFQRAQQIEEFGG